MGQQFVEPGAQMKLGKRRSAGLNKQPLRGTAVFALRRWRVVTRKRQPETKPLEVKVRGFARNQLGPDGQRMGWPSAVRVARVVSTFGDLVVCIGTIVMVGEIGSPFVGMLEGWR